MISITTIIWAIFAVIVGGLIFWLLQWGLDGIGLAEPWNKIARVLLILLAVFVLVAILLSLAGHPIVTW